MRSFRLFSSILLILMLSLASMQIDADPEMNIQSQENTFTVCDEIQGVPYVWQEVNGFCFPSALSMVLQSMGLSLSLYDILAASGSGFSIVSASFDETMMIYPGVMVRQMPWFEFFTDLYGLEMQFYLDSGTDYGLSTIQILQSWGSKFIDYNNSLSLSPLEVMKESIDSGYPLAISVDTYYLPPHDWDVVRQYIGPIQPGGVGHAIVIVGYNDTTHQVQVHDPGVGLLQPNYGYPDDGRWYYNMTYATLDLAWGGCGYATFRVSNGTGPVADFEDRLASYIAQKLIGNRSEYFEGYENFFYLSAGADAFRGMGLDMNPESIRDYCTYFLEINKPTAIRMLGHNLEAMMTMQYLAYRSSLDSLPDLLPTINLQAFFDEATNALPHMEVLSHNASITSGINIESRDSLLYNTFFGMADSFEVSQDLDYSINEFSGELEEISTHFSAIADAWKLAGEALSQELVGSGGLPDSNLVVVIGGGATILIIGVILVVWRRKPNQDR
ncbi:MAG: C39 family peptidase [Candidatus Thorarchaeota archaeon]